MHETCDVLVVGAGIAGAAVAERLGATGLGEVLLIEKETMPATGSTSRSAGGIRQQFGDPAKIRAAMFGFEQFDSFDERYGVDVEFKKHGYLILHSTEEGAQKLEAAVELQKRFGLETRILGPDGIKAMIPPLHTGDLIAASFNGTDGYLDPHAVVQGFLKAFQNGGGTLKYGIRVEALLKEKGRIRGVATPEGEIHAGLVVLTCGPQTGILLEAEGIRLPLHPCRRQIFVTGPVPGVESHWPLILDVDAPFYFRPEGDGLIMSLAEVEEMRPPESGNEIPLSRAQLPELARRASYRCPLLAEGAIRSGWAGLRTLTPDERPVLGSVPGKENLFLAAGFSGHGITLAPFAAEFLSREILGRPFEAAQREPFLPSRFL
jgi:sarcosine oxidase subunit beta